MPDANYAEIREEVAKLCQEFPGAYWREARPRARLSHRIRRRADRGRLARRADPGGIRRLRPAACPRRPRSLRRCSAPAATAAPATRRCTSWARCCGMAVAAQKRHYLPKHRQRRTAAAGVRRHRADQRHRHHLDQDFRPQGRRRLRRQWPENLDLARRAFRPDAAACAHDAEARRSRSAPTACRFSSSTCAKRQRPADDPPDPHDDEPRDDRSLLRQCAHPRRKSDRRGGQGLSLHPLRHERRAHPDRRRMHRRRELVHRKGEPLRQRAHGVRPARSARTRASSSRSRAPMRRCGRPI